MTRVLFRAWVFCTILIGISMFALLRTNPEASTSLPEGFTLDAPASLVSPTPADPDDAKINLFRRGAAGPIGAPAPATMLPVVPDWLRVTGILSGGLFAFGFGLLWVFRGARLRS
jgi:hypothetical protein